MHSALLLVCLVASAVVASRHRRSSVFTMAACMTRNAATLLSGDALCAAGKMRSAYYEMRSANCTNCDKYFHCLSNSRAVNECGNSTKAREATEAIGDCFWKGDLAGADNAANQEAYLFGRDGGDCKHEYLAAVSCAFNPDTKRCS